MRALTFDNAALRELPVDPNPARQVRASVPGVCFSLVHDTTPLQAPRLVAASRPALALVGLEAATDEDLATFLSGNTKLGSGPCYAHCYAGYQFGFFSGQLGDGAACSLGEVLNEAGARWEVQLKGAGLTPYSRQGDGRKVLRSSLREFLCSEAMHHLVRPLRTHRVPQLLRCRCAPCFSKRAAPERLRACRACRRRAPPRW